MIGSALHHRRRTVARTLSAYLGLFALVAQSTLPVAHTSLESLSAHVGAAFTIGGSDSGIVELTAGADHHAASSHHAASCPICRTVSQGKYAVTQLTPIRVTALPTTAAPVDQHRDFSGGLVFSECAPRAPPVLS